jgi:2',3'-cyclic-nucleotide 2'-phosphodiesterase (5'-nucleotidase family)
MMRAIITLLSGGLFLSMGPVSACLDGEHPHDHVRRADSPVPLTRPSRPLVWGDVNIIHTTDTHGWLLGHQKTSFPEPNYRCVCVSLARFWIDYKRVLSGDFGDFASFVAHMKDIANVIRRLLSRERFLLTCVLPGLGEGCRLVVG